MPKIVIKRQAHAVKVLSSKRKVSINTNVRKVTIRSASKRGLQGPPGYVGSDGKSAYEVWLDAGNVGTEQDFFDSLEGTPGAQGPTGLSGGSYSQSFAGSTIIITHNLGYIPNLTMFDTAGDEIEGAIIERDNNHFTVQFSASVSGIAYCS